MNPETLLRELRQTSLEHSTRRHFMRDCATGLGALYLASLGKSHALSAPAVSPDPAAPLFPLLPPLAPKVKRVIYLHMLGAPSTLDLFHYKPELAKYNGKECPKEFLEGQRFAFIQGVPKLLGPQFQFQQYGKSGAWVSDQLPHLSKHVDDLCFIHTMVTDQFNHGPAELVAHTGQANLGHPSIGSWVTWGLGTQNQDLPGFIVLLSGGQTPRAGKSVWGSGYLPSVYQGVQCRSSGDPVLNLRNPAGVNRDVRRSALDALAQLNRKTEAEFGDAETATRIAQYEMAFRMQMTAPEVMDISREPAEIRNLYGATPGRESFANNCLLARRLVENGTRFVQLFDWGWDSHGSNQEEALNIGFKKKCRDIDQPISALLTDLKQRGLLDDTLVIWSGEFGRTPMQENRGGADGKFTGRDHNPNSFTLWMAGAGVKPGISYGETDPLGYQVVSNPVHMRDFHATLLHLLGIDPHKHTFPFQGLNQKLIGVKPAKVVKGILA
jgi:hypothetical protein